MSRFAMIVSLVIILYSNQTRADYFDSINQGAAPEDFATLGFNSIGSYYKPTKSYSLTGISTFFAFTEFGTGPRSVTVQIQSDTPAKGGVVLDQGTFRASGTDDVIVGANFANPVQLTAGTTYFVDFLNVAGLGSDFGQYQVVNGVHVPTSGATTRLDAFYLGFGTDFAFATSRVGIAADQSNGFGSLSGVEPILLFGGTRSVPEPASIYLMSLGALGVLGYARRRKAATNRA